jgi:hypothetical protein
MAAAAVRSTVGFELPSDEALTRMGAGAAAAAPRRAASRRRALKALSTSIDD